MGKFLRKVAALESKSLQQRQPTITKMRAEKLRHLDGTSQRFIRRHGLKQALAGSIPLERRLRSHDSTENRHVKAQLSRLGRSLRGWELRHKEASRLSNSVGLVLDAIIAGSVQVERARARPFWRYISDDPIAPPGRALFEATYVSLERDFQHFRRGLALADRGISEIDLASMSKLYESWVFVRLAGLVTTLQQLKNQTAFAVECGALEAKLTEGRNASVRIGKATLTPQRLVRTITSDQLFSPYVPQQPDIFMELTTDDSIIIFDAKYRATVSYKGQPREFTNIDLLTHDFDLSNMLVTAKSDDYNVLHRYRDAILRSNPFALKACHAAYVLFPVRPASQAEALEILSKARTFQIAALPFLPGESDKTMPSPQLLANEPFEEVRCVSAILEDVLATTNA